MQRRTRLDIAGAIVHIAGRREEPKTEVVVVNPSRVRLGEFAEKAAGSVPSGSLVLDAGAGDCPYRSYFDEAGHTYESADFGEVDKAYGDLTYRCRLEEIPVDDGRFDLVLCSQVLEHLPEPAEVLGELFRVLRPGGSLWLTAPLFYEEHEQPYDFYRYTQFGIRHLFEEAGFEIVEMEWLEGYCGTVSHQLGRAGSQLPLGPAGYGGGLSGLLTSAVLLVSRPWMSFVSSLLARSDLRHRHTSSGHPKNYCVVATKPA